MSTLAVTLGAAAWLTWLARVGLLAARMFQIEEYEAPRLLAWSRQRAWLWPRAHIFCAAVVLLIGLAGAVLLRQLANVAVGVGWLVGAIALHMLWKGLPAKKPLVYTARMRRILSATAALAVLLAALLVWLIVHVPIPAGAIIASLACLFTPALSSLLVITGNVLMAPVEARIRQSYVRQAKARLDEYNPFVIGIAGSYGKTSTKHIMSSLLNPFVSTLATPKSFNTLMGVTRTINEHLQQTHRAFVVEMDAYAKGEIEALCRLVEPQLAIITAIGPQHLERFGTIEAIADAVYELVAALPASGTAIMYGGDDISRQLADRAAADGYKVVRYGTSGHNDERLDVIATDIVTDGTVTCFTWRWPAQEAECAVRIPLLGRHNVLNVSAALAAIQVLGHPLDTAIERAAQLEPVPHRLQLLPNTSGITIIDDSYNANPVGIHNGLDVLSEIRGGAKILVTPGLVELGSVEEAENRRLGTHAAQVCDRVILVGARQTRPIYAGLQEGGFAPDHIHTVQTLEEVTATLGNITKAGDVVLFANDLPDVYTELS